MKKFLAIVLAISLLSASAVEGFALIFPSTSLKNYHFIDLGDNNYSIPVDFSSPPSSVSGSVGDLNSWEEFLRRFSSNNYSLFVVYANGLKIALVNKSQLVIKTNSYTDNYNGSHTDYDYYLYPTVSFPIVTFKYDKESDKYFPLSCSLTSTNSYVAGLCGYCPKSQATNGRTFWHTFIYPSLSTSSSYPNAYFLNVNSLSLSVVSSNSHSLTVNYLYSENNPAADSVTQSLASGTEYSIPSPEVEGYTPDIPLVSGTMPDEDLTINVFYSRAFYPLTIKYQYTDGRKASDDISFQYPLGFVYDISSPEIEGYQADKPTIAGEMPGAALEEIVTYTAIPYTLTVHYQHLNGSQAASSYQEQLVIGSNYTVVSPVIEGYHPNQTMVTGVMPARDVVSTVTYRADSGGSSGPDPVGPGEGGDSGGGDSGEGGGGSGDDPFTPSLPPFSGNDPFVIPGVPGYSGYDSFKIAEPPAYSGYNPFVVPKIPSFSGYDPFAMPDKGGSD